MSVLLILLAFLGGIFGGLTTSTYGGVQSKARDTERKTDIMSMHAQLEAHYAENGYYPDSATLFSNPTLTLRGLDEQALIDPNGKRFNQGGDYTYEPRECAQQKCQDYTLRTKMEDTEDYVKLSLN